MCPGDTTGQDELLHAGTTGPSWPQAQAPHPGQGVADEKPVCPSLRICPQISLPFPELKGPSLPPVLYWSLIMIFLPARAERG